MTTRRGGFTLAEMLVVIILLAVFASIAGRLFMALTTISRHTQHHATTAISLDAALRALRADTRKAASFDIVDPHRLTLQTGDATPTEYRVEGSILHRSAEPGEGSTSWAFPAYTARFRSESNAGVTLELYAFEPRVSSGSQTAPTRKERPVAAPVEVHFLAAGTTASHSKGGRR